MKTAIYPGSFDPVTLGHLNIIRRAADCFDKLVVCVMVNGEKSGGLFLPEERVELLQRVTGRIRNVEIDLSHEMLSDYTRTREINVVVKGLRAVSDFEKEFQMALINRRLNPDLDTMFLMASEKYMYLSSSVAKELGSYGADLRGWVPVEIADDVSARIQARRRKG